MRPRYSTMEKKTKWERSVQQARAYGITDDAAVKRIAKHIFARKIVGGATIGRVNGRLVIHRDPVPKPKLP